MKKTEIRKAVAKATEAHVPKTIKDVARSRAFNQVYDALVEDSPAEEAAESPAQEAAEMPSETITAAGPGSNTAAAAIARAMAQKR